MLPSFSQLNPKGEGIKYTTATSENILFSDTLLSDIKARVITIKYYATGYITIS
jgi:hypothetical protein